MNAILLYLLEVNIIVTVVYLAYRLLLSRDTHFQWRRAFMLAGVTVAVVFPLVDFGVTAEKVVVVSLMSALHCRLFTARSAMSLTMSQLMCSRCSLRYMCRSLLFCCSILS